MQPENKDIRILLKTETDLSPSSVGGLLDHRAQSERLNEQDSNEAAHSTRFSFELTHFSSGLKNEVPNCTGLCEEKCRRRHET